MEVSQAEANPTRIEATFSGTLTANNSATLHIRDGRFNFRE